MVKYMWRVRPKYEEDLRVSDMNNQLWTRRQERDLKECGTGWGGEKGAKEFPGDWCRQDTSSVK